MLRLPEGRKADAGAPDSREEPRAAVPHFDGQRSILTNRAHVHVSHAALAVDAVLDRVLDDRLQDHGRHEPVERIGRDAFLDAQPIGKPNALDRDVVIQEVHFAGERNFFGLLVEGGAQQVAQPADRLGHRRLIAFEGQC